MKTAALVAVTLVMLDLSWLHVATFLFAFVFLKVYLQKHRDNRNTYKSHVVHHIDANDVHAVHIHHSFSAIVRTISHSTVQLCSQRLPPRSHSGRRQSIGDFAPGTVFHEDAECTVTMTADPNIVQELIARTSDFPKLWNRGLQIPLQEFTANGLFTSSETSDDWKTGHALLPRGFNQIKIKSFAPQILAKTRAFVREWSNFKAGHKVEHVNDWLTAMTADAVVSCSMGMDMRNVERLGANEDRKHRKCPWTSFNSSSWIEWPGVCMCLLLLMQKCMTVRLVCWDKRTAG